MHRRFIITLRCGCSLHINVITLLAVQFECMRMLLHRLNLGRTYANVQHAGIKVMRQHAEAITYQKIMAIG